MALLCPGQQLVSSPAQEHSRRPLTGLLRRRARVQWRTQQAAPRKQADDALRQLRPDMEGCTGVAGPSSSPIPAPPNAISSPALSSPSLRRPAADACVCSLRQTPVSLPVPMHHGAGIMHPPASRHRRHQRPIVRRAILAEPQQEQPAAAAACEPDAQLCPEASPCPFNTKPLQHGFIEAWICIYQAYPGGPAEVYEHSSPMNDVLWAGLQQDQVQPVKLMTVHQRSFRSCKDVQGSWANFRVRLSRGFSPFEEMTMFPNHVQLLGSQGHTGNTADASNTCSSNNSSSRSSRSSSCLNEALKQAEMVEVVAPAPSQPARSSNASSAAPSRQAVAQDMAAVRSHCPDSRPSTSSTRSYDESFDALGDHSSSSSSSSSSSVSTSINTSSVSSSDALQVQRRCHNARSLSDLVQLLADPTETGVLAHLANAGRVLSYRPRRIWDCLKARWGAEALHTLGFTPRTVHRLLHQGAIYDLVWQDELLALHHYRDGGSSSSGSSSRQEEAQRRRREEEHRAAQQAVLEEVRMANRRASSMLQAAAA